MKNSSTLALILTIWLLPKLLFAQTSIENETKLNTTLLNNASTSQQINPKAPTSFTNSGPNGGSNTPNLTDQEKQLSETFVDQAKANKIMKEKCVGDMQAACAGQEPEHTTMGMNPMMIKMAAQAYASIGALGGENIMPLKKDPSADAGKSGEAAKGDAAKGDAAKSGDKKEENATDYCKYIPAATETFASFAQKQNVDQMTTKADTSQKEALLKAAKSHDSRAEQAQIQAYGWFGGAACYAQGALTGQFAKNTSLIVKLGASTFLGAFYQGEVSANKEYADKTRMIANSMPNKGDCNPITQNECYCSTPEYANDQTYCKAQIEKRTTPSSFSKVACTNDKLQIDPSCQCDKTNTCVEKLIENQGGADLQMGMGFTNSPYRAITSLAHGKLETSTINGTAANKTAAIARQALKDLASRLPSNNAPLNPSLKPMVDTLVAKGIPSNVARLMAENAPSGSSVNSAMSKFNGMGAGPSMASYSNGGGNNVLDFSGGNGLGTSGRGEDKKNGSDDILGKFASNKGAVANGKIIEFAQKAQNQASQITKSDRPLFEIISLRYQISGRRLLQIDSTK